jgi:quinol monooxygenase YgiN
MITITMRVPVKPEKRAEFLKLMRQLRADVLANEPECLAYDLAVSDADPNLILFYERFATAEAHAAHPDMPYHKAVSAAGWACLAGEPQIERFTALD